MTEFRQEKELNIFSLIHNDNRVKDISIRNYRENDAANYYVITAENRVAGETLLSLVDKEIDFPNFQRLAVHNWSIEGKIKFDALYFESKENYFEFKVSLEDFDIEESEIDSLNFITGLKDNEFSINGAMYGDDGNGNITIELDIGVGRDENKTFLVCVLESQERIERFCGSVRKKFLARIQANVFLDTFDFPNELKIPCEQYLLYFAQFLQDLGIAATSNLKEDAGKVLFSVTPTDDVEALDKIREALAVYLNLPSSPIIYDESFAAMRLQAEIERLQSSQRIAEMEFRVAHKALESQDKIILQQSILLKQQAKSIEKITSKSVMIDSAENQEELVKIYEGAEFGHSKWLFELTGIKLNPVKTIKTAVKNTLGKGDEIISLGLDKKE